MPTFMNRHRGVVMVPASPTQHQKVMPNGIIELPMEQGRALGLMLVEVNQQTGEVKDLDSNPTVPALHAPQSEEEIKAAYEELVEGTDAQATIQPVTDEEEDGPEPAEEDAVPAVPSEHPEHKPVEAVREEVADKAEEAGSPPFDPDDVMNEDAPQGDAQKEELKKTPKRRGRRKKSEMKQDAE